MRPRANPFLLATILCSDAATTVGGPALHALPGFGHRATGFATEHESRRDTAISKTPPLTTARSAIFTHRVSLSLIPIGLPAWKSSDYDPRNRPSSLHLLPSPGHRSPAPLRSSEILGPRLIDHAM